MRRAAAALGLLVWLAPRGAAAAGHEQHAAAAAGGAQDDGFRVVRVFDPVPGFAGGMTFDSASGRLFLVSSGPPANVKGPSILYELDPASGRVLHQAVMPFEGELPSPACVGGILHQGVPHQSRIYQIDVRPGRGFGAILGALPLPTLDEIDLAATRSVFRFPFVSFHGMTGTPDGKLLVHAQELGDLVEVDPATGRFTRRIPTLPGLAAIAAVPAAGGGRPGGGLLLASSDPARAEFESEVHRFMFRAAHTGPPLARPGKRDVVWLLLDAGTGEVLATHESPASRADAGALALLRREEVPATPYGRLVFLAAGEEGLIEIEWTPERGGGR